MNMTPEMMQSVAFKIKALFAKTVDNGATEDEAMAAVAKARELMDKYSIDMGSVEFKAEGFEVGSFRPDGAHERVFATYVSMGIAKYTETRCWASDSRQKLNFFGLKSDVLFAEWLYRTLLGFIDRQCDERMRAYKIASRALGRASAADTRNQKRSFLMGAASRIGKRLKEVADARMSERGKSQAGALVVVSKSQLITEEMAKLHLNLRASSARSSYNSSAYNAGDSAGNRATWSKPVNAGGKVLSIGGRS